jgi:hypothetical protein
MIHIYAVHLSGGTTHQHIASVRWKNPDTSEAGENSRAEIIQWLNENAANRAYVCGGGHLARVLVVNANSPYIRSYADGVWTDNLLALPRY